MQKQNPYAKSADPKDLIGLCFHISLQTIYKWYVKFKPDFVVFAFEGGSNWRKVFTTDAKSRKGYKANRVVDPAMKHFYELIDSFKKTMKAHTSICCLSIELMEADDAIAGYCQLYGGDDHEIYIVSGDKDFTQLLKIPNVKLVNPDNGKFRNSPGDKDYEADLDYWLFKKCIRGDMGDNVPSAFPRVRETRIKKAYESDYERINFMNEKWHDEEGVEHKVGDLYEENRILVSLHEQPEEIRKFLLEGIEAQTSELGSYSHFHFLKFLEEYQLQAVREKAMNFIDMFTNNQRFLKGEKKAEPLTKNVVKVEAPEAPANPMLEF